jgi:hypothetical protein
VVQLAGDWAVWISRGRPSGGVVRTGEYLDAVLSAYELTENVSELVTPTGADAPAGERHLLLTDISGYTGFMTGVEREHGVDFSAGIPAAYGVLGALLDTVIAGVEPDFALVKLIMRLVRKLVEVEPLPGPTWSFVYGIQRKSPQPRVDA